jgi:galactokinase
MTGGGFGGCTVSLVQTEFVEAITTRLATNYKKKTGIEATIFTTRPAAGATVVKG